MTTQLRFPFAAVAVLAFATTMSAQYSVTGSVVDSDSQPCISTVYHIYQASDTIRPVLNGVSDPEGFINQTLRQSGEYVFQTEYIGLKSVSIPFVISDTHPVADLGQIRMEADENILEEVVVTGRRPIVISDGANLEYNIQEDPTSQTSTILDMLRKVPMVTVDGNDNIRVNGSTNFRIYLNGKPNPMFDSEPQRVLKAMPASAISRIEVLTEPGAKYDAEGTGGILNLVTDTGSSTQVADGYAGNVSLEAGVDNMAANVYARGKYRNVSGSASVTYATSKLFHRKSLSTTETEYLDNPDDHRLVVEGVTPRSNDFNFVQGNASFNWEPNKTNLFTMTANVTYIDGNQDMFSSMRMLDAAGTLRWSSDRSMWGKIDMTTVTADATYLHLFDGQDHTLTASFQYSRRNQLMDIDTEESDILTTNDMDTHNNEYTLQVDWHKRIDDRHTVEAGAKGILTDNRNTSQTYIDHQITDDFVNMKQYRNIAAAYAGYKGTYGKVTANAGLRYEYTNLGVNFLTPGQKDFDSHLNDLVPNASLSYSFSPVTTLRAAYNMRISRPDISQLNPYEISVLPNEIRRGNPDLTSQRSNNVSLSFSSFAGKVGYSIKAEYQNVANLISSYMYSENEIIYDTYINSGRQQKAILSAYANWMITPKMMLGANAAVEYTDFKVTSIAAANSGWSGNFGANYSYSMPWRMQIAAYGGLSTRTISLQGKNGSWNYYGLALSRNFLANDALKVSISAMNMFTRWNHWISDSHSGSVRTHNDYARRNWNVSVSIGWNFGHLNSDIKTLKTNIDNDDSVKTGGGQGGGIIN